MENMEKVNSLKEKMWKKQYFLMSRKLEDPGRIPPVMLDHYEWMIGMEKSGTVFLSGPVFEADGKQGVGLTIFRAESWEAAEEFAKSDPFVSSGAVSFQIQKWQINEGRVTVQVDFSDQSVEVE